MSFSHTKTISKADLYPLRAKGGVSPEMALGSMPTRPALLLRVEDSDGCFGWGEIWANFPPRANQHKAHLFEDVISPKLSGRSFAEPREIEDYLRFELATYFLHIGQSRVFEHILAGLDLALWDLSLRRDGRSFASFMGLSENSAAVYASSINLPDFERLIGCHARLGQRYFKLKIGVLGSDDLKIAALASVLCPDGGRIMVDSNQSWSLDQAINALHSLEPYEPLFAEEPLPADAPLADWEKLAKTTSIPLAGGENIYGLDEFRRMTGAGLRYLQPDVAKWGGVTGALELAGILPEDVCLWPHFMGTAIGQFAALAVTVAAGDGSCCEMDVNSNELRSKLCGNVLKIRDGRVPLSSGPGLTTPPDMDNVEAYLDRF